MISQTFQAQIPIWLLHIIFNIAKKRVKVFLFRNDAFLSDIKVKFKRHKGVRSRKNNLLERGIKVGNFYKE